MCIVTADAATAKELLLMAPDVDEQKKWVMNLSQKVVQPNKNKRYVFLHIIVEPNFVATTVF